MVSAQRIDALVAEHGGPRRTRLFPPAVTLGLFVEQAISSDSACQDAVGRYLSQRTAMGLSPCGLGTGSYCKARQRLPASLLEASVREVAGIAAAALPASARWRGREVKLIDGTHVSMPDTPSHFVIVHFDNPAALGSADPRSAAAHMTAGRVSLALFLVVAGLS